ncbi:MAG: 4-hydroxybenzoate polyprenyltransferase [Verrucomicrobiales bacterium]|jgi:4-hydroxybenzoate polyprenyltransferase
MHKKIRALLDLGRVSNLPSVVTNVLAAWVLAGATLGLGLLPVSLGAILLYLAGTTLNDAVDAKFDREHRPGRPIPAGVFGVASVWAIGLVYAVLGGGLLVFFSGAYVAWIGALIVAILIYDIVHKKWKGGVFVMGSCRLFLYMVAASAAVGGFGLEPLVLLWAAALFLYIVGLTFVARGESTGGGVSLVAIAFIAAPVFAAVATLALEGGGVAFGICLIVMLGWIGVCLRRLKGEDPARIGQFVGRLLAGIPLIDALAVSSIEPWLGVAILFALPLSMGLQRLVAAT